MRQVDVGGGDGGDTAEKHPQREDVPWESGEEEEGVGRGEEEEGGESGTEGEKRGREGGVIQRERGRNVLHLI